MPIRSYLGRCACRAPAVPSEPLEHGAEEEAPLQVRGGSHRSCTHPQVLHATLTMLCMLHLALRLTVEAQPVPLVASATVFGKGIVCAACIWQSAV